MTRRTRGTNKELAERDAFLVHYAAMHKPVTVRQLFYAATVHNLPGVTKDDKGYGKVQRRVLELRKNGMLPYEHIADMSRSVWGLNTFDGLNSAAASFSNGYKLDFWRERTTKVEVWLEKTALAAAISPVTKHFRVDLAPTTGFCSEGFAELMARSARNEGFEKLHVYSLYDFDASGQAASSSLGETLGRLSGMHGLELTYAPIALTFDMVHEMKLPTREAKRKSERDKRWPYDFACELDAIPPEGLRTLVRGYLERHMTDEEIKEHLHLEQQHKAEIRMALDSYT